MNFIVPFPKAEHIAKRLQGNCGGDRLVAVGHRITRFTVPGGSCGGADITEEIIIAASSSAS